MRLSDLNLDAAGNSFIDVSDDMVLAAGCGFTRVELKHYFAEHLRSARAGCAKEVVSDAQVEALLNVLKTRCGLYAFDRKQHIKVFAPDAVLRFWADEVARS